MEKKEQKMRYNDEELSTIKDLFAENDDLLRVLRKVFLQMPLNAIDLALAEVFKTPKTSAVLRKAFLPALDPEAPINQITDLWFNVDIASRTPEEAMWHLKARRYVINYLNQQLESLGGKSKQEIRFEDLVSGEGKDVVDIYSRVIARNDIIKQVEGTLNVFKILAGFKNETLEQTQERLRKDSSK